MEGEDGGGVGGNSHSEKNSKVRPHHVSYSCS